MCNRGLQFSQPDVNETVTEIVDKKEFLLIEKMQENYFGLLCINMHFKFELKVKQFVALLITGQLYAARK